MPPASITKRYGVTVDRDDFAGMPVWTIRPPAPSGRFVVALHGGGYYRKQVRLHWQDYATIARDTGATFVVPDYPLAGEGGTAARAVPKLCDLTSGLIAANDADAVSLYGDSAGGGLALAVGQEMVRRNLPVPGRVVLLSPYVDVSMSNPDLYLADDPLVGSAVRNLIIYGRIWAGELGTRHPMASPLYGSFEGLSTVTVYVGSLDMLHPDQMKLRKKAIRDSADAEFVLRKAIHVWPATSFLPETRAVRRDLYRQLIGD